MKNVLHRRLFLRRARFPFFGGFFYAAYWKLLIGTNYNYFISPIQLLQFHTDIPSAPNNGTEITDLIGITDHVNVLTLGYYGRGMITNREDYGIGINNKCLSSLILQSYVAVTNLAKRGFKIYGNFIGLKEVTEIACVGKADLRCCSLFPKRALLLPCQNGSP